MIASSRALLRTLVPLSGILLVAIIVALATGYQSIRWSELGTDETTRTIFFQLRAPRVFLGVLVGGSLAGVGAALQALFRNPLAEPFTLGVSGGGALGASIAIALGVGSEIGGIPLLFICSFVGALCFVGVVYRLASGGTVVMPGALLLAGVVLNLVAGSGILMIQFLTDPTRALQILRWMVGSLDIIGMDLVWRMAICLLPGLLLLLAIARDLHLIAVDQVSASALGVNILHVEKTVYVASSLVVGVSVAVAGPIGFVGLIVPHTVRLFFGEDLRVILPASILLGAAFLVLADTVARTLLGASELPVGVVTALLGGPLFLFILNRRRRYTAI